MYTELLSVVDQDDCIIDQQPRNLIHANRLRHRAVHILVFNRQGQLFLQKRSMQKDLNAGLWDTSAAGHVDAGEDYNFSANREIKEELGVTASLVPLFKLSATPELGMEFIQVYRCTHDGPFILNKDEIDEGNWFSHDEVSRKVSADDPLLTETFKIVWRQFCRDALHASPNL